MENNIVKTHTSKDLIISGLMSVIGIALTFINLGLGIAIIIVGVCMFIFYKAGFKYENQGAVLCKKSKELSKKCQKSVTNFLNGETEELNMIPGNEGGTLMLDVWYNKQEGIAYAQLFEYQELNFKQATELIKLESSNARILIEQL